MATFIRVRDRDTGHEYDIDLASFDEELHTKVNASKQYPDLVGDHVIVRPIKFRTDKAGAPATTEESA